MMNEKKIWDAALERSAECVGPEQFAAGLSESATAHVAECPRCQAERALWSSFEQPEATADEGAAVPWIAAELKRRAVPKPVTRWWQRFVGGSYGLRAATVALCTILVAVGITFSMRYRGTEQPVIDGGAPVYRSTSVTLIAPVGDQATAPVLLQWQPHAAARQYRVRLMEVDRTILWSTTAATSSIRVPSTIRAVALPGKTLLWQVEVIGTSGEVLASSTVERFRVRTKQIPDGE